MSLAQWRSLPSGAARFCLKGPKDSYLAWVFEPAQAGADGYGITRAFGFGACRYKAGALVLAMRPEMPGFAAKRTRVLADAQEVTDALYRLAYDRRVYPDEVTVQRLGIGGQVTRGARVEDLTGKVGSEGFSFCLVQPSGVYAVVAYAEPVESDTDVQTMGFGMDGSCSSPGLGVATKVEAVEVPLVGARRMAGVEGLALNPFVARALPNAGW